VKFHPPPHRRTEKQYANMVTEAGRIVSRKNTPRSKTRRLLKKFKQSLSELEKDEVRTRLKREVSTALQDGGISTRMTDKLTLVFVSLLIEGVELGSAETGDSIILYLKCETVESLLSLKEMILSGLLLQLLSDTIEEFIETRIGIQLIVKTEDYNLCLFYLRSVTGKFVFLVLLNYKNENSTVKVKCDSSQNAGKVVHWVVCGQYYTAKLLIQAKFSIKAASPT